MTTMPLSGIRILDLGRLIAAPSCTQILADLGAEVIKVERPVTGDEIRTYGPPFLTNREGGEDDSPYHLAVNRNKKSITIDIATREGQDLILELAKVSDVFMENFKVGDLKRYGLDYDSIREMNPGIVYCSLTGFGQTGPSAHRPGLDSLFQAMSGLMSVTGEADGAPQKVGIAVSDFIAGLYASIGILGALRHREVNKGEGQHIDIALLDSTIAAFTNRAQGYLTSGINPVRNGSVTPGNQPAGLYGCSDGDIILSAGADRQFKAMVGLIGRQDLAEDARFQSRPLRVINAEALNKAINDALSKETRAHWLSSFEAAGVMCAPINTVAEAFEDPQIKHRGVVVEVEHPRAGPISLVANPIRYSGTPVKDPKVSPDLGQHTDAVLGDLLGLSAEALVDLRRQGAI